MQATTRSLDPSRPGAALDPRTDEISWIAVRAVAARAGAIASETHLAEALRATSDVLERTWQPGRTAAFVRIEAVPDAEGRTALSLHLASGTLGAPGDSAGDANASAAVVLAALGRYPEPFTIEQVDPAPLLERAAPRHLVAIRQRWYDAMDEETRVRTPSRFDHQLESWLELAHLLGSAGSPVVLQSAFLATELSAANELWLEHESARADALALHASESGNRVLCRRAIRIRDTLIDIGQSYAGPLWLGEVTVGSDAPLPHPLVRAIAAEITNELDVVHAHAAGPIVAGRQRIVGGFELEQISSWDDATRDAWELGLPGSAFQPSTLRDHFSLTEASYCFRWPVAAGRALDGIPMETTRRRPAPPGLPTTGLRIGRDSRGSDVFLGPDGMRTHIWAPGGTGAGKSTFMRLCIRHDLAIDRPFVLVDAHGDLTRAVRDDAADLGRVVALIDVDEAGSVSLDLLGGLTPAQVSDPVALAAPVSRLTDAVASYRSSAEYGPRYRSLARAQLETLISAAVHRTLGIQDMSRLLVDQEFCESVLKDAADGHAAKILRLHMKESDRAGVALWAGSKFEDVALSPGAARVFAPFFEGVSVQQVVEAGIPLLVNLGSSGLSRIASSLLGHIVLACTVDYVLSRGPGERAPLSLYIDEAQRFPSPNLVDALAETRKYGCSVFVAHQELSQLAPELRDALLANASTRVLFRVGLADAHALAMPTGIAPADLAGQPNLHAFVQLAGQVPFSVELDPPGPVPPLPPYEPPPSLTRRSGPGLHLVAQVDEPEPLRLVPLPGPSQAPLWHEDAST